MIYQVKVRNNTTKEWDIVAEIDAESRRQVMKEEQMVKDLKTHNKQFMVRKS